MLLQGEVRNDIREKESGKSGKLRGKVHKLPCPIWESEKKGTRT